MAKTPRFESIILECYIESREDSAYGSFISLDLFICGASTLESSSRASRKAFKSA
jgi:hypothetical protein